MLATKINNIFGGVSGESINWMKHYLNGGDDVGAPWNGIADSVSGYTYKYSNQFEFSMSKRDINVANLVPIAYGQSTSGHTIAPFTQMRTKVIKDLPEFEPTFVRLPYPDLPALLFLDFKDDVFYNIVDDHYDMNYVTRHIVIPIEDPNWLPDSITVNQSSIINEIDVAELKQPAFATLNLRKDVVPGFSQDITAYRMAGASMTLQCTAPVLTKNGSIVACTANCPYGKIRYYDNFNFVPGTGNTPGTLEVVAPTHIYMHDAPIGYNNISSVKSYKKFEMNEGAYVVLHNTQGTYLFTNFEENHALIMGAKYITGGAADHFAFTQQIVVYNNGKSTHYHLMMLADRQYSKRYYTLRDDGFFNITSIPRYYIPDVTLTEWNTAFISPVCTDADTALIYTLKVNSYVECYVSSLSKLKPSVSMTSRYYPRLLEYLSEFYHDYDGIYPSYWNSKGKIWNLFKQFLLSDAVGAAVTAANPTAGAIVSTVQSVVAKYFNKISKGSIPVTKMTKKKDRIANAVAQGISSAFINPLGASGDLPARGEMIVTRKFKKNNNNNKSKNNNQRGNKPALRGR